MLPGERFKRWIDDFAMSIKDRLRGWMVSWLASGLELILDIIGRGLGKRLDTIIDTFGAKYDIPADTLAEVKEAWKGEGEWQALLGGAAGGTAVGSLIGSTIGPWLKLLEYQGLGLAKPFRFDPLSVITAWRRDPGAYATLFDDLKDQGWNDERIEALKFVTLFYPAPADLVRWQAREVFEPKMIDKYGLDDEIGEIEREPFYKAGMTDEQITNYWRAHWEHPEFRTIVEMLRRTDFSEADMRAWFRLVEIPPYWRQKMVDISWEVPTRVDVRRWWDMRTIDEARLRKIYTAQGYHGEDLEDYVRWTKVYTDFPVMMARFRNGWIEEKDIYDWLIAQGIPEERARHFIEEKVKAEKPERTVKERDVTKTDIIRGVKTEVITRGEGEELLVDMGYDADEAAYILEVNIPPDEEDKVVKERELSKTDIKAGIKKEILSRDEARSKLLELRYKPADVEFLLDIYEVVAKPPPEPRIREASKADIVLGVKKGLITQEEGYGMLLDLEFTPEAADFILMVKTEESPFSPINYAEFKDLTAKYKRATGREAKPMSEELKKAADEVVRITGEIEALNRAVTEEKRGLVEEEVLPEEATARLEELQVKRNRAEAELQHAKLEYDRLVAEWRHGEPET